ncbi:hypothetical protein [Methanolobus bombayensis]|uniref:hypothetical protein n=1 Tax=Methanolobus bombayensis TaxID=38023 RepID=UPI001AE37A44|nr:hypothetical protein [Methanolobus bombayensis]MBP1909283.1 signal transduction histidine kinase [Methanolobus bombayensis]
MTHEENTDDCSTFTYKNQVINVLILTVGIIFAASTNETLNKSTVYTYFVMGFFVFAIFLHLSFVQKIPLIYLIFSFLFSIFFGLSFTPFFAIKGLMSLNSNIAAIFATFLSFSLFFFLIEGLPLIEPIKNSSIYMDIKKYIKTESDKINWASFLKVTTSLVLIYLLLTVYYASCSDLLHGMNEEIINNASVIQQSEPLFIKIIDKILSPF